MSDASPRRSGINQFLNAIADAGLDALRAIRGRRGNDPDLVALCHELLTTTGEATGTAVARDVVAGYEGLAPDERPAFFERLARDFDADPDRIATAAAAYAKDRSLANRLALSRAVEAPRQELFRRIHTAPGGGAMLVRMREHLLALLDDNPGFQSIEADLRFLLKTWFNRGFLAIERIDWNTPAAVLERLIDYESVHEIRGWDDLRRRLAADRRCFAFFHPALPGDPVIFVEVALVKGLPDAIAPLIDRDGPVLDPSKADTAIFYSINNCHEGLQGISFGNFLIKQVVVELQREFPAIDTFATLSPVPGFARWLKRNVDTVVPSLVEPDELAALRTSVSGEISEAALRSLEEPLTSLCAHYLVSERRGAEPLDPVARFHLRNGASLERINWMADCSPQGLRQAFGFMVNYLYEPKAIERNHEAYERDRTVVAASRVQRLVPRSRA